MRTNTHEQRRADRARTLARKVRRTHKLQGVIL